MCQIAVSVIVPVYNVEKYLSECLDSILNQNFDNYEIICINDASTDKSGEILQKYAAQYGHIRIFTHTENKGLSAARNTGFQYASGKYIWFVDSDDMIAENSLVELFETAEQNHTDILQFNIVRFFDGVVDDGSRFEDEYHYDGVYTGKELFCLFAEDEKTHPEVWRRFLRRSFLTEQHINFYEGLLHEDVDFSFFCFMKAKRAAAINKRYYFYRQRVGSIMKTRDSRRAESLFVVLIRIIAYWESYCFTERENRAIAFWVRNIAYIYKFYRSFGINRKELSIGGYVEKFLYTLPSTLSKPQYLTLGAGQMNEIKRLQKVIVFGAGRAALDIIEVLKSNGIRINVVGVSDMAGNPQSFCGIKVDTIENISRYMLDGIVIIGVTEKHRSGIREKLEQLGFVNILIPENVKQEE